jgi:hypothetical protein
MTESPPRRFRAAIGELMGLVALAALACVWPALIPTETLAVLVWVAARGGSEAARARFTSLAMVLATTYLCPLVTFWLVPMLEPGWSDGAAWRSTWSGFFPIIPGILPTILVEVFTNVSTNSSYGVFLRRIVGPRWVDLVQLTIASLITAAVIYALTWLAGRSRGRRIIAATLGFLNTAAGSLVMLRVIAAP